MKIISPSQLQTMQVPSDRKSVQERVLSAMTSLSPRKIIALMYNNRRTLKIIKQNEAKRNLVYCLTQRKIILIVRQEIFGLF